MECFTVFATKKILVKSEGLQARGNPGGLADCSSVLEGRTAAWNATSLDRSSQ
jgi:hypothetical protein